MNNLNPLKFIPVLIILLTTCVYAIPPEVQFKSIEKLKNGETQLTFVFDYKYGEEVATPVIIRDPNGVTTLAVIQYMLIQNISDDLWSQKKTWDEVRNQKVEKWELVRNIIRASIERLAADSSISAIYSLFLEGLSDSTFFNNETPTYDQLNKLLGSWLQQVASTHQYRDLSGNSYPIVESNSRNKIGSALGGRPFTLPPTVMSRSAATFDVNLEKIFANDPWKDLATTSSSPAAAAVAAVTNAKPASHQNVNVDLLVKNQKTLIVSEVFKDHQNNLLVRFNDIDTTNQSATHHLGGSLLFWRPYNSNVLYQLASKGRLPRRMGSEETAVEYFSNPTPSQPQNDAHFIVSDHSMALESPQKSIVFTRTSRSEIATINKAILDGSLQLEKLPNIRNISYFGKIPGSNLYIYIDNSAFYPSKRGYQILIGIPGRMDTTNLASHSIRQADGASVFLLQDQSMIVLEQKKGTLLKSDGSIFNLETIPVDQIQHTLNSVGLANRKTQMPDSLKTPCSLLL